MTKRIAVEDLIPSVKACEVLGVSQATLSRWVNSPTPKIRPALQLAGIRGAMLFKRVEVERLAQRERASL